MNEKRAWDNAAAIFREWREGVPMAEIAARFGVPLSVIEEIIRLHARPALL